jgi:hypothetical protein
MKMYGMLLFSLILTLSAQASDFKCATKIYEVVPSAQNGPKPMPVSLHVDQDLAATDTGIEVHLADHPLLIETLSNGSKQAGWVYDGQGPVPHVFVGGVSANPYLKKSVVEVQYEVLKSKLQPGSFGLNPFFYKSGTMIKNKKKTDLLRAGDPANYLLLPANAQVGTQYSMVLNSTPYTDPEGPALQVLPNGKMKLIPDDGKENLSLVMYVSCVAINPVSLTGVTDADWTQENEKWKQSEKELQDASSAQNNGKK